MTDHEPVAADSAGLETLLSREPKPLFRSPKRLGSAWWVHV
jgi:hypothetical protein